MVSDGGGAVLSREKRQLPVFGFLSFLMLILNSVMLILENVNINNNNNNNNNNDNNNNNNNLNKNTNGRGLMDHFEDLAGTVVRSLMQSEEQEEEDGIEIVIEENKSFVDNYAAYADDDAMHRDNVLDNEDIPTPQQVEIN
jgi:hypothetical protein